MFPVFGKTNVCDSVRMKTIYEDRRSFLHSENERLLIGPAEVAVLKSYDWIEDTFTIRYSYKLIMARYPICKVGNFANQVLESQSE